ncbi:hypothetical protein [Candidatus Nanohalococcus occultus]|uniref:hypothetical protein n=1 Tax=Candidatus Nanohalococcus occultus TaxID=2978047 RepID=UPI0039E1C21E
MESSINLVSRKKLLAVILTVFGVSLIGLAGAELTNRFSNTAAGEINVQKGFVYGMGSEGSEFSTDLASGSDLRLASNISNLANDRSQPAVEVISIGADSDLSWRHLESVEISRANEGTLYRYRLDVGPRGEPELVEKRWKSYGSENQSMTFNRTVRQESGEYFGVRNSDVDGDSSQEIHLCIGDRQGKRFQPDESWNGTLSINTKSSFPNGPLEVTGSIYSLYDPETGTHPRRVRECVRFN